EVEEPDPLADGPVLDADALEEGSPRPAPAALVRAGAASGSTGHEIVGALPAVLLAEHRARLAEPSVERAQPARAGPLVLVVGIAEHVVVLVRLARALRGVRAVLVHRPEAPHVQLRHVVRRFAVHEPVGDDVADRAAGAEARVREACRDPEPGHARYRTEQGTAVGGDALGAVHQMRQLGLRQDGHSSDGALEDLVEQLPVRWQELLREVPRHAADRPRDRASLEATDEKSADLLTHVDEVLRIAQARSRARELAARN